MGTPPRLVPLLDQYAFARERLAARLNGPVMDSGNGTEVKVDGPLADAEYFWEPVAGCLSVRLRDAGPGPRATELAGRGDWGRDASAEQPRERPPFTTLSWRLSHLTEMLTLRADHTAGTHALTRDDYLVAGDAATALADFDTAATAWHEALLAADDRALDTVGYSTYPHGSDPEDLFLETVWWVNQELLHHGAEIALLRDLYRDAGGHDLR
ncbi:DinB family protein [Streptomyces sp. NBC_01335]|uniref:DinB family protein n=1 Tax=Streptomyces sp. NBC_01335 TaxID=2903828 RepID=UPI002E1388EA|nr:DinB family protein [Streptomyces sp. NBC_01335]